MGHVGERFGVYNCRSGVKWSPVGKSKTHLAMQWMELKLVKSGARAYAWKTINNAIVIYQIYVLKKQDYTQNQRKKSPKLNK